MRRFGVIAAFVVAGAVGAKAASADEAACVQSYETTQTLRKAGKLKDARAEAEKCATPSCPAVLTKDCAKWQSELDAALPSIVLDVKAPGGAALANVRVTMNGQPLVDKVDATPIAVDPGTFTLHFEGNGAHADQSVSVKDGEKAHRVAVTLGAPPPPPPPAKPLPLGPIVFGAAGVVAAGVGAVFAIAGHSAENDLDACKGHCSAGAVNGVSTKYAVSDILFTAGAVSLVAAAYMLFTRPSEQAAPMVGSLRRRRGFVLEF